MITNSEIIARLTVSCLLGLIIGIQREVRHKPAGLRTNTLIALGSTLFTIVASSFFSSDSSARIIAQIITGIGFLGAGTIFRHKDHIEGLTTAACVWSVAGMGMAVGLGEYFLGVLGFVYIFIVLSLYPIDFMIHKNKRLK
jgi:putative Mg2+ transporter-C (MgtC) family protein